MATCVLLLRLSAELDRENWEIIQAHVVRMQVALGSVSFQKLDDFVRHVVEPKPPLGKQEEAGPIKGHVKSK